MKISREPIQEDNQLNVEPSDAHAPACYAPPKLEKIRKLAQVTGLPAPTGAV